VYYLRNQFEIGWRSIKLLLNHRDQSWLWQLMKLIRELKPKLPADDYWIDIKKKLDKIIFEYVGKISN
jgi:hypothetical protein